MRGAEPLPTYVFGSSATRESSVVIFVQIEGGGFKNFHFSSSKIKIFQIWGGDVPQVPPPGTQRESRFRVYLWSPFLGVFYPWSPLSIRKKVLFFRFRGGTPWPLAYMPAPIIMTLEGAHTQPFSYTIIGLPCLPHCSHFPSCWAKQIKSFEKIFYVDSNFDYESSIVRSHNTCCLDHFLINYKQNDTIFQSNQLIQL